MQISLQRVQYLLVKFSRNYNQFAHKQIYKMNIAYFRYKTDENEFQITFRYVNDNFKIDRTFNFSRYITENILACMDRIKTNVEKEFLKKSKKKNKKKVVSLTDPSNSINLTPPEIIIELYKSGILLTDGCFKDILDPNTENNLVLRIIDSNFKIVLNSPWVSNIILPTSILAGFIVYPTKVELQFAQKSDCEFKWYRGLPTKSNNDEQIKWIEIGEGFTYATQTNDIDHKLKVVCTPKNKSTTGPVGEYISKCVVDAGPGICPYEIRHIFTKEKLNGNKFRVMTYNLLADLYCDSDFARTSLFSYCPPYALNIDYRKQLFIKEILGFNSDIICLQEVDGKIFELDLEVVLNSRNIDGVFKMKGTSGEGLATFYDNKRFEFIKHDSINIGENIQTFEPFSQLYSKIKSNTKLVERIVERATAIQVTTLKPLEKLDQYLVIANTHLYFHPDADHIRLLQIGFSMLYLQYIIEKLKNDNFVDGKSVSLIFCGDFNSVPECGIFQLMTKKFVNDDFVDWSSNKTEAVTGVTLSQPFSIESACGCPKYTNFTVGFAECLDYIFYQTDNLRVNQVIPMPSAEELKTHIAIPSVVFPSDHISLVADLEWK